MLKMIFGEMVNLFEKEDVARRVPACRGFG